jgi:CheY-like chemotaxis protein
MKTKILVVDDEPDALEVLGFKLREAGYTPIFAKDGTRAIAIARDEHPDLIVLDLMLPEVDGLEVCKILRRDPSTASIPDDHADGPRRRDGPGARASNWAPTTT